MDVTTGVVIEARLPGSYVGFPVASPATEEELAQLRRLIDACPVLKRAEWSARSAAEISNDRPWSEDREEIA